MTAATPGPSAQRTGKGRPSPWRLAARALLLLVGAVTLYGLLPQLLAVFDQVPELTEIRWWWFIVMVALEAASLACLWLLIRVALPGVSWFLASTAQLASNAVSKFVPAGAAMGTALDFRMLSVAGVPAGTAATALTATGFLSAWVLFALPFVALLASLIGSPVPRGMAHVAWGGATVFVFMFVAGLVVTRSTRPLRRVANVVERSSRWVLARFHRESGLTADGIVAQRDQMVGALGARWSQALAATIGNWLFEYLALVAALLAVGSRPRLSLVLLAFAVSAVLTMVPITPGGLGFVEAGLTAMLTLAGVGAQDALLATLAYRVVSYWLPLPAGVVAYLAFRHRYGRPPPAEDDAVAETADGTARPDG
ncbi:MAG: lysylphosphatidylglycerol synthase transmembrane domain-containing protein [Acidimicrobiia bacterium]|nr:lysylphosphatidylglycerol synthase transmembrane domain-containing protein [Acidimicrobiia bacterium]